MKPIKFLYRCKWCVDRIGCARVRESVSDVWTKLDNSIKIHPDVKVTDWICLECLAVEKAKLKLKKLSTLKELC